MTTFIKMLLSALISILALLVVLAVFDIISFESAKENSLNVVYALLAIAAAGLAIGLIFRQK